MKLCFLGIHKWTQWKTPRNNIQTRVCMYCGIYQRVQVLVTLTANPIETYALEEIYDDD